MTPPLAGYVPNIGFVVAVPPTFPVGAPAAVGTIELDLTLPSLNRITALPPKGLIANGETTVGAKASAGVMIRGIPELEVVEKPVVPFHKYLNPQLPSSTGEVAAVLMSPSGGTARPSLQ